MVTTPKVHTVFYGTVSHFCVVLCGNHWSHFAQNFKSATFSSKIRLLEWWEKGKKFETLSCFVRNLWDTPFYCMWSLFSIRWYQGWTRVTRQTVCNFWSTLLCFTNGAKTWSFERGSLGQTQWVDTDIANNLPKSVQMTYISTYGLFVNFTQRTKQNY